MGLPRFRRPVGKSEPSSNLYVANCGPAVGLTLDTIEAVFGAYGQVKGVHLADESGTRVIVSYHEEKSAESALKALNRLACPELGGRSLHIQYSVPSVCQVAANETIPVSMEASELDIPGLYLIHDFISANEEEELLAAVDTMHWKELAKRRVQHYGYEFQYSTRNVNTNQYLGELPSFLSPVLEKMSLFQKLGYSEALLLDQLTVNEYPPGIDVVNDTIIRRASRRVSFTLRKVRKGPCECEFPEYCDSQKVKDN
ncbi:hypothetical protein HAX54_047655 [Datura stramonium]|uniref:RRM domain-containing protein n=1 Tax=Datura stramonium TaxID=4076 RepID=A0ABS8SSP7_DATST|nr:hypothetical protein [Datura stramonium]